MDTQTFVPTPSSRSSSSSSSLPSSLLSSSPLSSPSPSSSCGHQDSTCALHAGGGSSCSRGFAVQLMCTVGK
eukprot:776283-Pelagomonas_calceolata.AAC.3